MKSVLYSRCKVVLVLVFVGVHSWTWTQWMRMVDDNKKESKSYQELAILSVNAAATIRSVTTKPGPKQEYLDVKELRAFDVLQRHELSPIARFLASHQANCNLPQAEFRFRNKFGLGSDFHVWSQALCNAVQSQQRVLTLQPADQPWIYRDVHSCSSRYHNDNNNNEKEEEVLPRVGSCLQCYFSGVEEGSCPLSEDSLQRRQAVNDVTRPVLYRGRGRIRNECQALLARHLNVTDREFRTAAMEFLFSRTSALVLHHAHRLLQQIFFSRPDAPTGRTMPSPKELITVHVRWGDKRDEMELVPIPEYIQACRDIMIRRNSTTNPHIFLATSDPDAVQAMRQHLPVGWHLYVDPYYDYIIQSKDLNTSSYREEQYNADPLRAQALRGQPGLWALASLLVSLQADNFVLTTASNWSLLINELRQSLLPRHETLMIDLRPSKY